MRLSARDQIILGVAVTILAAAAVFVVLVLPRFGEITAANDDLDAIAAERSQVETLLGTRQDAKARAAETQVQLLDIASQFPESPELPALIIELQDIANRIEIEFIQLAPGRPALIEETPVSQIPITVTITGTWEQYIDFMAALQGLRRAIRVTDFTVTAVPPEDEESSSSTTEGDGGTTTTTDDESDEPDIYTVSARVGVVVYMMSADIEPAASPAAPGAPANPAESGEGAAP